MPEPFAFEPCVEYVIKGVGYRVLKVLSKDQILVKNLMTKGEEAQKVGDLLNAWDAYGLAFGLYGRNLREDGDVLVKTSYEFSDLDFLDPDLAQETWDRYQLILPLLDCHPRDRTDDRIENDIKKFVAEQLKLIISGKRTVLVFPKRSGKGKSPSEEETEKSLHSIVEKRDLDETSASDILASIPLLRVSSRTVRRWIEEFVKSREDIRSLVPAYSHRGRRGVQLSSDVTKLLDQAIEEIYKTELRAPVTHVIDKLKFLILEENKKRPDDLPKIVMPANRKVYRYIDQLDPMEVDTARLGRRRAQRKHQQYHRGPRPPRPNMRWEEDDTLLDLFVIDGDDGLPIGRPLLTAVRDKNSAVVPGLSLSFEPSSARTVMECLFYAIPEKRHVKSLFNLRNDYIGYGVPEVLAVDRGKGYIGKDLERACAQLHIELDPMPAKSPWLKGSIERFLGTNATDLIHVTPGTSFSNFLMRGDYNPAKHACITLDGLWYLLHKWIVDVYTREGHRGIGVPAKIWERALERDFVPRLPASRNELAILLSRIESRVIQSSGIEFENLWYQDTRLSNLRAQLNSSEPHIPVEFKYNPGDLSRIWVLDPFEKRYLEVLAEDREYTQGLSIWKHLVIKRYIREEMKQDIDEESLILAKEELHQAVSKEFRQGSKLGGRKKAARFLDIQVSAALQRAYSSVSNPTTPPIVSVPIDFERFDAGLSEAADQQFSDEQARDILPLTVEGGIARLDVPLPPMVEGIALLENEETIKAGNRPPESDTGTHKKRASGGNRSNNQVSETPKINTDPDETSPFGIGFSYGRSGPT